MRLRVPEEVKPSSTMVRRRALHGGARRLGVTPLMRTAFVLVACLLTAPLLTLGGAAVDAGPTHLIELKAAAPEWWTPEVMAQADRAAAEGKLLNPLTGETFAPQETAAIVQVPIGGPDYLFIRPGSLFLGESGALCTYNFIYGSGTQIGTAGHCVEKTGERVYILATPGPTVPLVTALGTVASFRNSGIGNDWALININSAWHQWVDPNMAWIGGPSCAAHTGTAGVFKTTGHGLQTGLVASVPRYSQGGASNGASFNGIGGVSGGDSGSAIIKVDVNSACAMGAAAGVITHCGSIGGLVCLPLYYATDIRKVPATVTVGLDPL